MKGVARMFGECPSNRVRLPVFKVKGGHDVLLTLRSRDVLGFGAHWLGARSFMCPGLDCPACEQFVGARWKGLLAVELHSGSGRETRFGLIEVTESAYGRLRFLRESYGRTEYCGMRVVASRRSAKSPLVFAEGEVGSTFDESAKAVEAIYVASAVATLYGLPSPGPDESLKDWQEHASGSACIALQAALSKVAFAS